MLTATPPSLQGRFSLVYSGDPALQPRPEDLPDDADEAARKERAEQQSKWEHDIGVARETGNWTALVRPGEQPSVFRFELPNGLARSTLVELLETGMLGPDRLGLVQRCAILVRALLVDVSNFSGRQIQRGRHPHLGIELAQSEIVDDLIEAGHRLNVGDAPLIEFWSFLVKRLLEPIPGK